MLGFLIWLISFSWMLEIVNATFLSDGILTSFFQVCWVLFWQALNCLKIMSFVRVDLISPAEWSMTVWHLWGMPGLGMCHKEGHGRQPCPRRFAPCFQVVRVFPRSWMDSWFAFRTSLLLLRVGHSLLEMLSCLSFLRSSSPPPSPPSSYLLYVAEFLCH